MSRIGKKLIDIPETVSIKIEEGRVEVSGPKGSLKFEIPTGVRVIVENGQLKIESDQGNLQGLVRTRIANAVVGVTSGWRKNLELSGTGYRASVSGGKLNLALGFSHPVVVEAPPDGGVTFEVGESKITVGGYDREQVGEMAAKIRRLRPADPYKLKGFKYEGEKIIKKAGKAAKTGTGAVK